MTGHCPTCRQPLRNLLAGCDQPTCTAVEIAAEAAWKRQADQ